MKQLIVVIAATACLFAACENKPETASNEPSADTTQNNEAVQPDKICYKVESNGTSASMQLQKVNDSLYGPLEYRLKEKDQNTGMFNGKIRGEMVEGYYTFQSEGQKSVRQEIFRMQGDDLIPANGRSTMHNDTTVFLDTNKLTYDTLLIFRKVNCQ